MVKEYDEKDPRSIEHYAKKMLGKTFYEIWEENEERLDPVSKKLQDKTGNDGYAHSHAAKNYKGGMGNLVEECFFHYAANSDAEPDFPDAGVELKVTPYHIVGKKQEPRAKERLILTMIDYFSLIEEESFEKSHLWHKAHLLLLVWYLYTKGIDKLQYPVDYVGLFTPPAEDLQIIKEDYAKIVAKVKAGKAHELSEADTLYLGAATKSSDSSVRRKQPNSTELAKSRAFSLKNSYMTYILNQYFVKGVSTYERILSDGFQGDFEREVVGKIDRYRGYSTDQLCQIFKVDTTKKRPKNLESMLAFRMLGIKGNQAEEFVKADIVVKAIRIEANGTIKQSMSFPTFKFTEIIQEDWEDSEFANYLRETRFLFVVYRFADDGKLYLKGCQFWNIPYEDLEVEARSVWEKTKLIIQEGMQFYKDDKGNYHNNLPKMKENRVAHVRPHGRNAEDTYPLPDGRAYPKQCFWLNNSYILSQIKDDMKR